MPDISVVMACYNGEKKIQVLLDSLRNQTCQPGEVLLRDDCSTDGTVSVVQAYIDQHRLSGWKQTENHQNLGWKRNFFQGMLQAGGDLIFLCDQDDEWEPDKIWVMAEVMCHNPQISLLACDYALQYTTGSVPMKRYRKKKCERNGEIARYQFTSRFFQNPSPGCTYVLRGAFLDQVKDYWFPEAPHDEVLWLMAALEDGAWFLNRNLMTIHRGSDNASDVKYKDIPLQQENLKYISDMLKSMERYVSDHPATVSAEKRKEIARAVVWCRKRQRLMERRNPLLWASMWHYWKYYNSFRNCLSDLYLVLFGSFSR